MDTHYMTVTFPKRFMSDEVREVFMDVFRLDNLHAVDERITETNSGHLEFEEPDSSVLDSIAIELNKLGVPAVAYQGGTYEYSPEYYLSYPKGDPVYPEGQVVTVSCNADSIAVLDTNGVYKELGRILSLRDPDMIVRELEDYRERVSLVDIDGNHVDTKLLNYYKHETDVGRNEDMSSKIDGVLQRLDNGELTNAEALNMIKKIREEGESECANQSA